MPSNATNKIVTWSTSNAYVATVNAIGVVTGKKTGTATITATTQDGNKKATCTVTVTSYTVGSIKVYQSPRLPEEEENGTIADDMKTANKTKSQLIAMSPVLGGQAQTYHELALPPVHPDGPQMLKDDAKALATLFTTGNSSMRTVANSMFDRFFAGTGGEFRNATLTSLAVNHTTTQAFINGTRQRIVGYLGSHNGNPSGTLTDSSLKNSLNEVRRPYYDTSTDKANGLTVCVNDTWGNYIEIKNYTCNGTAFSGTLRYTIYDHFGLNDLDVTGGYGGMTWLFGYTFQFSAWYVLQHYTACNSQYKPFITYIETEVSFSGTL